MTAGAALDRGLGELALALPAGARDRLLAYAELLAKWNQTYNLTAIRDPHKMVTHHLLDSLAVLPHLPEASAQSLADVGSGGGLPGIPLAIARPAWRVCLIESSQKKSAFLRQAAFELGLGNAAVHTGRAQSWSPGERFGIVISRAFAGLAEFLRACRHLAAPGAVLAAMKGALQRAELERVPADFDCGRIIRIAVPLLEAERHLVLCRVAG